jgi:hypothetical protein
VTIEELQHCHKLLHDFQERLATFDGSLRRVKDLKTRSGDEGMVGHDNPRVASPDLQAIEALRATRKEIAERINDVTRIVARYDLPYEWKIRPPAVAGFIRSVNTFEAFIDLKLEEAARPTLLQVTDLVGKAIHRCEKEIDQASPMSLNPGKRVAAVSRGFRSLFRSLSGSKKQYAILGGLILVICSFLILRDAFHFPFHISEIGNRLVRWVLGKLDRLSARW